ncbi:MAG: glycerol kinase GlpK [Subdoligranulum sp.]|nr:glycerol kinase GlpK [Subdoligranulum sp.]
MGKYILALDQGTTSSRAILFDSEQNILAIRQRELTQHYPHEGWVEQDPMEIWSTQYAAMLEVLAAADVSPSDVAGIGITNQRETTILWDKNTGRPIHNAIVWQCRRTADIVDRLVQDGLSGHIRRTTGLVPDAYFSGTKIKWLLDHVEGAREKAERGEILFGTVDSWLVWKLTGGKVHVTDRTNASRTMLYNIHKLDWDDTLLNALDIPRAMLPRVTDSSEIYGYTDLCGVQVPVAGIAGDQQAALFGQGCFSKGEAKNTYGTGCFLLMNTGDTICRSKNGLLTTIAISLNGKVEYALEGSVFVGGAVIQWVRDGLRMIQESRDSEYYAQKVPDNGGVYIVPAFTGLGAPYWDMYARGAIVGITRGTTQNHIIRAAEESIAYQSYDLVHAMELDVGQPITALKVDGGASRDQFLMQFQADILNKTVLRPAIRETTALGAAYLAGLATGVWKDRGEIRSLWHCNMTFTPNMEAPEREKLLAGWHKAVGRSRDWAEHE